MNSSAPFAASSRQLVAGLLFLGSLAPVHAQTASTASELILADSAARLVFERTPDGWQVRELSAVAPSTGSPSRQLPVGTPSGRYTFLYSATAPDSKSIGPALSSFYDLAAEPKNPHIENSWVRATAAVPLNTAGEARSFLPREGVRRPDGALEFRHGDDAAELRAAYALDPQFPGDIRVELTLTAKRAGFFSLATPSLATVNPGDLAWAVVPGFYQGAALEKNLLLSYGYGQGLPDKPVIVRESTASTLTSIITAKSGATLAVTAEPGIAADPWATDQDTRANWKLGLSHMNRAGALSPTLYHPVLGETSSQLAPGESRTFRFRYSVRAADWFAVNRHVAENIYRFSASLALREPRHSLTTRIRGQHQYVRNDQTSLWRLEEFEGVKIGAQSYMGAVVGAKERGDSIKNSDYGAMWMLAKITGDPNLTRDRLPFARNFKLKQVQAEAGFFQGAAVGQYYLPSSRRFTEEWGDYVEPVALTYYALLDLGNILLFAPDDTEVRARFKLSADRLLQWQKPDGSWVVGYSRKSSQPVFADLTDFRPTFYGLLVAHRVLGDARYLAAARRGADWLLMHAVAQGRFLGVCGDVRFLPDFATAQIAQALLDLHAATGDVRYREGGIAAARFYVTSVYTHPLASTAPRSANKTTVAEWEINQAGLSFEHGGLMGSAVHAGPILLASHAGLFIRVHQLTGETIFRDMARSAAVAREAFVDPASSVASYYWRNMNGGPGRFPHHAWWQIGWITDYLMSELALRSKNAVEFPRGFFTPKVGPHATYGFAPGKIHGTPAALAWGDVAVDHPAVDCIVARAVTGHRVFLLLMNEVGRDTAVTITPDPKTLTGGKADAFSAVSLPGSSNASPLTPNAPLKLTLPGYGLTVVALDYAAK
jgi:hypothetical protein